MKRTAFVLWGLLAGPLCVASHAEVDSPGELIGFESDRWAISGEIVEHRGRTCLAGPALLPDIAFENGIIEFDLTVDGTRGYPGITFRGTSPLSYEHVYIRPHAGLRNDGLQYAPAFGPGSDWQLYNGAGYTASVAMPANEWVHVRIEVAGRQARVFYGSEEPALVVGDLKHDPVPGSIGIRSARNRSACFSEFRVTKKDDLELGTAPAPLHPRGLILEWQISQPFRATDVDGSRYPAAELLQRIEWSSVPTESGGLLNLSRHVERSTNGEADLVFARTFLEASRPETRRFSFGYSDLATVFLNGRPLFSGNASYRARSPDYAGIIGLEDTLHLPLRQGRNELLFSVVETFGGWGLMGQDNSDDYLEPGLQELWRIEAGNRLPESVIHDPLRDVLYVTHFFRGGNEYIARLALDGRVIEAEWIAGLVRPTGMVLFGDRLWVVDRRHLIEIDIDAGKVLERYPIPGARFPNDVAFDERGNGYVSDTAGNRIYRFRDGTIDVWLDGDAVERPNGLLVDGGSLLFGQSEDGLLRRVDLADRTVDTVADLGHGANVDGIRRDGTGGYIVSDFNGRVHRVGARGEVTCLLDTTASGATSADLEYVVDRGLMIVPGLYDNRLTAYRLDLQPSP